jgi:preprotein translocase subunit Sec63
MTLAELRDVDPRRAWELHNVRATRQVDDPWAILGVDPGADLETIAEAHRRLAKRFHPDLPEVGDDATMTEVNVAYRELRRFYSLDLPGPKA